MSVIVILTCTRYSHASTRLCPVLTNYHELPDKTFLDLYSYVSWVREGYSLLHGHRLRNRYSENVLTSTRSYHSPARLCPVLTNYHELPDKTFLDVYSYVSWVREGYSLLHRYCLLDC